MSYAHFFSQVLARLVALTAMAGALLLMGCGGGASFDAAQDPQNARSVAIAATSTDTIFIPGINAPVTAPTVSLGEKLAEKRISRTVYEYKYSVKFTNGNVDQRNIVATLATASPGTSIVDGLSIHPGLKAGKVGTSADTITIRHDRALPFRFDLWRWEVESVSVIAAFGGGAQVAGQTSISALLGQQASRTLQVLPNDKRNAVTSLQIFNDTAGGNTPTLDSNATLSWTPNSTDYTNTKALRIQAQLAIGGIQQITLPVQVSDLRLVFEANLAALGGEITDSGGLFAIQITARIAGQPIAGKLSVIEKFRADGSNSYLLAATRNSNARAQLTKSPILRLPLLSEHLVSPTALTNAAIPARRANAQIAAPTWQSNIGFTINPALDGQGQILEFTGLFNQLLGSKGDVQVFTTRPSIVHLDAPPIPLPVHGAGSTSITPKEIIGETSRRVPNVFQIDANCKTTSECNDINVTYGNGIVRTPVILIHGFNKDQGVGGGQGDSGTWGHLADELGKRGHPVFEFRWNTYMRFEEAAGMLALLGKRVAEMTNKKPFIVAHSFGGVVAHQAMNNQGIRHRAKTPSGGSLQPDIGWHIEEASNVFKHLVTLGSPLSGISSTPRSDYELPAGRDADEKTIPLCEGITCFQAGNEDFWNSEIPYALQMVRALDANSIGLSDGRPGESIRKINAAINGPSSNSASFTTIVSLKTRPFDYFPTDDPRFFEDAFAGMGDGLISIFGQAAVATDFAENPFPTAGCEPLYGICTNTNKALRDPFVDVNGITFISQLDSRDAHNMEFREVHGRRYYFALHASHTSEQDFTGGVYPIAKYPFPAEGSGFLGRKLIKLNGKPSFDEAKHPLWRVVNEDNFHLSTPPTPYNVVTLPPQDAQVRAQIENGSEGVSTKTYQVRLLQANGVTQLETVAGLVPSNGSLIVQIGGWIKLLSEAGLSTDMSQYLVELTVSRGSPYGDYRGTVQFGQSMNFGTIKLQDLQATGSSVFLDTFDGSALDAAKWTSVGFSAYGQPVGPVTVSGGLAQFGAYGRIDTKGKVTFTGSNKIVIEARMTGLGSSRDTGIYLYDTISTPTVPASNNVIMFGDTNYWGGMYLQAYGRYSAPASFINIVSGTTTNQWMEYRLTVNGTQVTLERGPTLQNIIAADTRTMTLSQSVVGRSFYVNIGTGGPSYSPGTFDWIRVKEEPAVNSTIVVPASSFLSSSVSIETKVTTACDGGLVLNAAPYNPKPNSGDWSVPVTTAGTYRIEVEYAAALSRPVEAFVDGVLLNSNALADTSGSWCATPSISRTVGTVSLAAGNHIFRLQRSDVFPHLKEIRFVMAGP